MHKEGRLVSRLESGAQSCEPHAQPQPGHLYCSLLSWGGCPASYSSKHCHKQPASSPWQCRARMGVPVHPGSFILASGCFKSLTGHHVCLGWLCDQLAKYGIYPLPFFFFYIVMTTFSLILKLGTFNQLCIYCNIHPLCSHL